MTEQMSAQQNVTLNDVPETMLWTLHNRASEAMRADGVIQDPDALRIHQGIDYDYMRSFGKPDGSHGMRSKLADDALRSFLAKHPKGTIVNLGEGLETQRYRLAPNEALWFSIDLPEAIEAREQFIKADGQHRHLAIGAMDFSWMDEIPSDEPVFITAQGLFMYFTEKDVKSLIQTMASRFPNGYLWFDFIPEWLSQKTMKGWKKTKHYTTPKMPWGVRRDRIIGLLKDWVPRLTQVRFVQFIMPRGLWHWLGPVFLCIPYLRHQTPGIIEMQFPE